MCGLNKRVAQLEKDPVKYIVQGTKHLHITSAILLV